MVFALVKLGFFVFLPRLRAPFYASFTRIPNSRGAMKMLIKDLISEE
jgi:hypothetical protein